MADVFANTELVFNGAFTADKGLITSNKGFNGILMQNIQITYSQQITRLYELGNAGETMNFYYVGGRSQGTMQIQRVVGPQVSIVAFYTNFSDVCKALDNDIEVTLQRGACGTGGGTKTLIYKCKYCVIVQVGIQVQANDLVVNENCQLQFGNMEVTEGGGGGAGGAGGAAGGGTPLPATGGPAAPDAGGFGPVPVFA